MLGFILYYIPFQNINWDRNEWNSSVLTFSTDFGLGLGGLCVSQREQEQFVGSIDSPLAAWSFDYLQADLWFRDPVL